MTDQARTGALYVLVASLLWGTTGTAATMAPTVGPMAIAAGAWGIGGLLLGAAASRAILRQRRALVAQWRMVTLAGVSVAAFPLAFYTSMRLAGVAVGTVVSIGSAPLAAAVVERVADRQPLTRRWAIGAVIGLLGVTSLAAARAHESGPAPATGNPAVGIALGLLAGLLYAVFSWAATRVMRAGVSDQAAMGATFGLGGLLLLPMLLTVGAPILQDPHGAAVVAYLAIVPMFLGYVLFGRGLATTSATVATTLSLLEPAVAALIALLVLNEQLSGIGLAGLTLLLISVVTLTDAPMLVKPLWRAVFRRTRV